MRVKKISKEVVRDQGWKPEPHTVSLKDDGEWWGCVDDEGRLLSVVCVSDKHGGKYFSETYTPPGFRNRGFCSVLLGFLAKTEYKNELLIAHCLKASFNCYKSAGFNLFNIRKFKHGDQYFMKREVNNG